MTWVRREDLEDQEVHGLSRHATQSRAWGRRLVEEPPDPLRTAFQRDRDRIIHCTAFRRLQHKTQVFAAHEGDHYRSRMTHSLEVSQLSRSVALALRLNADLCEGIALAHDLGHPPFGHVGERMLDQLLGDHGGFRHNAQGLRIVDFLEQRREQGHGLNLTTVVRRGLLKGRVPDGFPLSPDLLPKQPAPVEAEVVDLCDKIAYVCHDLDDALRAGIVSQPQAEGLTLWQQAADRCRARPRGRIISEMVAVLVEDLVQTLSQTLEDATGGDRPKIRHSGEITVAIDQLLRFLREEFYRSRRVLDDMERGQERIRVLFDRLSRQRNEIPEHYLARIEQDGLPRVVCDYIAGMTDRYLMQQEH